LRHAGARLEEHHAIRHRCHSTAREADGLFERAIGFAARVEALGFAGLWTTDSFARGSATLDPLLFLSALCQATERIELGTCVTQVPLRHPVEQAHRAQTSTCCRAVASASASAAGRPGMISMPCRSTMTAASSCCRTISR
jgi:hypothetical protein